MSGNKPTTILRSAYRVPDYLIEEVDLYFDLREAQTRVEARLQIRRRGDLPDSGSQGLPPLVLDGEDLELLEIEIDGRALAPSEYRVEEESLTIERVPERFELRTVVRLDPASNTQLSGLYQSSGNYCTQCEAMGFRRITYFLDRPDVMSRYRVSIEADRERCPVLLSNGNRIGSAELPEGRHRVDWEDPFPKPSYLFALVAGNLRCHSGSFRTMSGRDVQLEIWVEPQNIDRCEHALRSLKLSMEWDEEKFGREYDLDLYMIVAVGDFNMGAMENKGLNIFNSKFVLASPETATDDDYEGIESVIAHEYFHNWTGNRVTCRDWFQLTLKEGLTVYRDQLFSEEMGSEAVNRIASVKMLRARQFPEDEGPMAHPIRPESYISMDNFYTATVYEKGAEVIRMYATLLGEAGFRKGMDLYFDRHDGQAVTCDDFRFAMADANGRDFTQFERWYTQAGTPRLRARGDWHPEEGRYRLTLSQDYPETAAEISGAADRRPLPIPVRVGLIGPSGESLPVRLATDPSDAPANGNSSDGPGAEVAASRVLEFTKEEASYDFVGLEAKPVPSLLRGFSAPVRLEAELLDDASLAFLMAHDSDPFNRWDAGQQLALKILVRLAKGLEKGRPMEADPGYLEAFGKLLRDESLDGSLRALAMALPAERVIAQEMEVIEPDAIHTAREFLGEAVAEAHAPALWQIYRDLSPRGPYRHEREEIDRRRLRNAALATLACTGSEEAMEAAWEQFAFADNMTDSQAALIVLAGEETPRRLEAIEGFYERWKEDPLVLDKWFSIQASSRREDTLERVEILATHPDFNANNPNRVRSLVTAFCSGNQVRFHEPSGRGYVFLADWVLRLASANPQLASRLASIFNDWRRYDVGRQSKMQAQLERIAAGGADGVPLSKDVYEIVNRALSR